MWDEPDFRVPYDLKFLPIFDYANPIMIKLTLISFSKFASTCKKINSFYQFTLLRYSRFQSSMILKATPIFDHNHPKTSNNKHDWKRAKYLNVLRHKKTKKLLQYFFLNILQKFNKPLFLGNLDLSGNFHQKSIIQLVEILILMNSKMSSIHNFFLEIL